MFRLRGHHLLCLLGYRGMGYSKEYVENMTSMHDTLRTMPDTEVHIVSEPDDLCLRFPETQPCHCDHQNIHHRDSAMLEKLGIKVGQTLSWRNIEDRIKASFEPADIDDLCRTCSWRAYGVCHEGVTEMKAGRGLRPVQKSAT